MPLTPKDLIALQGTIAEVFPGSVDAIRSVNVNDDDELEIIFRSGTTLYRTVSGDEGMSEPEEIGEVEPPKQDSALYRYDGQDWVLDDPLLNLQGYPLRMDAGRSKPCPGGYRIPLTKKCRNLNALKKDLRHAGEHVSENVAAWSVGKVVGGAIAGVAASHGLNPDLSKQIAETGVQALTATLIHARKRENRQPGELARKFVSEAAGAFAGKMAHSGVDDAILGGDDHVKMLAAAMAGKTTGATVTPSVGSVLKRGESALNSILGRQRSDSIHYDTATGISIQLTPEEQEALFDLTFLGLLMAPTRTDSVPDKYSHISFLPPQSVRSAFQSGLELHKKGVSGDGLEPATVREATSISKGQSVTPEKVRKAAAWFGRNKRFARMPKDSPAWASWMLWGGDAGRKWFEKLGRLMDAADQKVRSDASDKKNKRNKKIAKVLREFKQGELSIGKSEKKVKSRRQAVAIALSEASRTDAYPLFKKKLNIGGQTIGITHQAGDTRYDRPMLSHYGMVMGTYGQAEDGKAHDIYVEPGDPDGMCLYCIDQIDPGTRQLDERKYFLSKSVDRAKNLFILHAGPSRFGGIRKADWNEFGQQGDRTDAKKSSANTTPVPCGKGWVGTKPPGCQRAKAATGKAKTATKTTKTTTKKTTKAKATSTNTGAATGSGSGVKVNQQALDATRTELEKTYGKKLVTDAEKNVKKILDSSDVFIRVGSASTLELILGDRFKTSAELGVTSHQIPNLKDKNYQDARNRVEQKTLGYDLKTKAEDRPIYGYFGNGKDINGASHQDLAAAYGSIAVKLKPEVKKRATFTGSDSFKSGYASESVNNGAPPPPNAASMVGATRHGYDVGNLPSHYPRFMNDRSVMGQQLRAAALARTIDDLPRALAPTGNAYIEAQIHGKVTPSDIAEIHFSPSGVSDRPNAAIAKFAKANKVALVVNGKKLSDKDLDDLINPKPSKSKVADLNDALDRGDIDSVVKTVEDLNATAKKIKLNPGEKDAHLKALYQESGFDGLPKVGTASDVTNAYRSGGTLMIRGVSPGIGKTDYLQQFQTSDYYVGNGIYGNGTYVGHAGKIVNGRFVPYDKKTEKKDAKRAFDDIAKHGYIGSSTTNFRMALDPSARVTTQTSLLKERDQVKTQVDSWQAKERLKIIQAGTTHTKAEETKYKLTLSKAQKEVTGNYSATPTITKKRDPFGAESLIYSIPGSKPGSQPLTYEVKKEKDWYQSLLGKTTYQYVYFDEKGNEQTLQSKTKAEDLARKAAIEQEAEKRALRKTGYSVPPVTGKPDMATQAKLKEFDDKVKEIKHTIGIDEGDPGGLGRFAVVRGYDAVALDQSYEPETFMNLLNRSKVIVQKDPLDYKKALKTGALQ